MSKYAIRTDLAIEAIEVSKAKDGIKSEEENVLGVKITRVDLLDDGIKLLNKKKGRYITIEFEDVTDTNEKENVKEVFSMEFKKLLSYLGINENDTCLLIGLGNQKSTPDALGPAVVDNIIVTNTYLI